MALPKLNHPTIDVKIPSTKEKATFRPYTVKEQKILLMLKESSSPEEIVQVLKNLISSTCVGKINPEKLAYFDIEYLFLKIRAFSVGEKTQVNYKCNNVVEDSTCGSVTPIDIDISDIEVDFSGVVPQEIQVGKDIVIKFRYPSIESANWILDYRTNNNFDSLIKAIVSDVTLVKDSDSIYDDFTQEELTEFVNSLPLEAFDKVLQYYISCPTVKKKVNFKCKKCGYSEDIILSGIQDFFE